MPVTTRKSPDKKRDANSASRAPPPKTDAAPTPRWGSVPCSTVIRLARRASDQAPRKRWPPRPQPVAERPACRMEGMTAGKGGGGGEMGKVKNCARSGATQRQGQGEGRPPMEIGR